MKVKKQQITFCDFALPGNKCAILCNLGFVRKFAPETGIYDKKN